MNDEASARDRAVRILQRRNNYAAESCSRQSLDECLLTPDEFASGPLEWLKFPDPFQRWDVQRAPTGANEVNA